MKLNVDFNKEIKRIVERFKGDVGCIVIFVGVVKRKDNNRGVICDVDWEKMKKIKEDMKKRQDLLYLDVKVNSGLLEIGDLITTIFSVAYDRKSAFRACMECVDKIKREGVRKKEIYQ